MKSQDTMNNEQDSKTSENEETHPEAGASAGKEVSTQKEIKDLNDKLLRLAAELQNLKIRTEKEKSDISKFAISAFAKGVLTIRDNLLLALKSCSDGDNTIAEGIKMTVSHLDSVMEKQGIKIVEALNKKFDPTVHQAINEIDSDKEKGTVVAVMQEGFTISGRLLRPALVSVAK